MEECECVCVCVESIFKEMNAGRITRAVCVVCVDGMIKRGKRLEKNKSRICGV